MQKITYIKNVKYYNKKMEPIDTVSSDKKTFSSLNDAIENVFALAKQNFVKSGGEISDGVWEMPLLQQVNAVQLEVWEPMPSIEHKISRKFATE